MVNDAVSALAETVASPDCKKMVARLIGSVPDHPQFMAVYRQTFLLPRRKLAAFVLEKARAEGLIREDADKEIILDVIAGAIMYRLLIHCDDHSESDIRPYLRKILKQLGLLPAKQKSSLTDRAEVPDPVLSSQKRRAEHKKHRSP
jgi:hypothetical protein